MPAGPTAYTYDGDGNLETEGGNTRCSGFRIPNADSDDFQSSTVGRMQGPETYKVYVDLIGFSP